MSTTLHTFIDIFETTFTDGQSSVKLKKIIIPIIQRDYAQGRTDPEINRVRAHFLDSLYDAVNKHPITLDFVYGDIDQDGVMTPLDGQQRLTTLFLLHWYAVRKEKISNEESEFLQHFGYETRYSARNFCRDLTHFMPSFANQISEEIIDQAWFPLEWKKDPTVSSMLVMIDAIHQKFGSTENLWEKLMNGAISFYFLPIKDMGLTDEIYIKMNSRGKPLTRFEHFKAELERVIKAFDEETANRIIEKIDQKWTDLLWSYRDSGNGKPDDIIIDDEFLKYFRFICDIICYKGGESPQGKSSDEFDLLQLWFTGDKTRTLENISILETFFDCWCNIDGFNNPTEFLKSIMTYKHTADKVLTHNKIDIFEDCLHSYADKNGRTRLFPLGRIVLLYAIVVYLRNQTKIPRESFIRRLRTINNLIQNSEDEVSDRIDGNRLPAILLQTDSIILNGEIKDDIDNNFNVNQLIEEKEKQAFLEQNPNQAEQLFYLEDHTNLKGQIGIIGLDHIDYVNRFYSLFSCNLDKIDRALMAIGNYSQQERNKWRYQVGSKSLQFAWDELFHRTANSGFENTHEVLIKLLSLTESFSNQFLDEIAEKYMQSCEIAGIFPWRYYYVKYDSFRPGSFGKLSNNKPKEQPYMYVVLQTKSQWSENTYMPYLKEVDDNHHLSRDSYGQRLEFGDFYIECENASYRVRETGTKAVVETISIKQNEQGIDIEDRIVLLRTYISKNF